MLNSPSAIQPAAASIGPGNATMEKERRKAPSRDRLTKKLQSFHRQRCSSTQDAGLDASLSATLKCLVTSRPYTHIQSRFQMITDSFPNLHLKGEDENDQIHQEIDLVVKMQVEELARSAFLSSDIKKRLEEQLLQMEHRTYLWLHLAIDDIRSTLENSLQPALESIQAVPPSVDEAYTRILSRVPPEQMNVVRKALQIIVAARRPLSIVEMAMALG
ncbi:hypothetical protein N7507_008109 [Penicillium longicatenatum]|nr:hypothetical protein N7507_008109 [Penicillium longicatenatum]